MESDQQSKIKDLLPDKKTLLRASIAALPYIGGSINHLLFDKADAIRANNITLGIAALEEKVRSLEERLIDKNWFESEEALSAFKILNDKISYEADKAKIKTMGRVTAALGLAINSNDKNKLQALAYIGDFSSSQIALLKALSVTPSEHRTFSGRGLQVSTTGIWLDSIMGYLQRNNPSLINTYMTDIELLEAKNTVRRVQTFGQNQTGDGYKLTEIGKLAAKYLEQA